MATSNVIPSEPTAHNLQPAENSGSGAARDAPAPDVTESLADDRVASRVILSATLLVYLLVVVQNTWLCDDAFVAFRAGANAVLGSGLVANPGERVQGFTSPLWTLMFALAYSVLRNAYGVGVLLSLACSLGGVLLLALKMRAPLPARAFAVAALTVSTAYVHYSTSGLENPLSHLLLIAFALTAIQGQRPRLLWALSGLAILTRFDHALLVLPVLVYGSLRRPLRDTLRDATLLWAPLWAWLVFSVVYYGFPFPNTAYAKLNTSRPALELAGQGLTFLFDAGQRDPVTMLMILLAPVAALVTDRRRALPLALGIVLYLAYVVRVGGDFMAGRFLSAPFLLSVVVVCGVVLTKLKTRDQGVIAGVFGIVALLSPRLPMQSHKPECRVPKTGIVDERDCYVETTGLALNLRSQRYKEHDYFKRGVKLRSGTDRVAVEGAVGMTGYAAGPDVHIIDKYALTEPLLARLPFHGDENWRIGHFRRDIPAGYLETVRSGENQIEDPCLHQFYDHLSRVIRGPIFRLDRFRDILRFNLGSYDHLAQPNCPAPPSGPS